MMKRESRPTETTLIRRAQKWLADSRLPKIGATTRIYLGVRKHKGRFVHTVCRGEHDVPRTCRVLGYKIEFVGSMPGSVNVLVTVSLASPPPLLKRIEVAHVACLEEVRG